MIGNGGMSIYNDGKFIKCYGAEDGIKNTSILSIAENSNGDIILGSDGGGLYIINDKGIRNIGTDDGLSSNIVMRIIKDHKRDLFWLVTNNSISFMTEDYKISTVSSFPYINNFDLYQNSKDDMWILSSNGIYVIPTDFMVNNIPCIIK